MDIFTQIINGLSLPNKSLGDFEILGLSHNKENPEFENTTFTLLDNNGKFFGKVHISKRIVVAFAQNLLKKKNIVLLPEFIDTSSLILISEILNSIEEKYPIHLEISPVDFDICQPTTDFLLNIKYQKIFAPIIIQIDTEQLLKYLIQKGLSLENTLEIAISLSGERYLPLQIIGSLRENDHLKIPKRLFFIINNQFKIAEKDIFYEEDRMENLIQLVDEIEIPVAFKIDLGSMTFGNIRDLINKDKLSDVLNGKECRIIIGTTIIATGEFNENHVKITKVYI